MFGRFGAAEQLGAQAPQLLAQAFGGVVVTDTDQFGLKDACLLRQEGGVGPSAEGDDAERLGMRGDDLQRLDADGAGGAEDGDAAGCGHALHYPALATGTKLSLLTGHAPGLIVV